MSQETYGFLHCHSEHSLKDSPLKIKDLCQTAKEMGATAVSLTDHGTCTGIIEFLDTCRDLGINGIPGVEAYVRTDHAKRAHLVLLAKNYKGYKEICMAVSESNRNLEEVGGITQAIMDEDLLKKYFGNGNVIALSACVAGVLASILLSNKEIEKKIAKLETSMEKLDNPNDPAYIENKSKLEKLDAVIKENADEAKRLEKLAKKSYQNRIKGIDVLQKMYPNQPEMYLDKAKELTREMEESESAKDKLAEIKAQLKKDRTLRTNINQRVKKAENSHKKYYKFKEELDTQKQNLKEEAVLKEMLKDKALEYKGIFGNDFYIELQNHGLESEQYVMPVLADLAKELKIPVVATNDVHIKSKEDVVSRQFMKALRFHTWEDPSDADAELYMKTDMELYEAIKKVVPEDTAKEAMRNIRKICDVCHVEIPDDKHYPGFRGEDGNIVKNSAEELKIQALKGITKKFKREEFTKEYQDRFAYELKVITELGYADYLLIVADYINYAKNLSITNNEYGVGYGVGPGRGSGAGCLINYLLGITNIDPIKYGLIFERFLNKDRVSMPDIDTDFSEETRNETMEYVKRKYGSECVAVIRTLDTQGMKASIRNSARVLGFKEYPGKESDPKILENRRKLKAVGDKICKGLPQIPSIKMADCEEELKAYDKDPEASSIIRYAREVEGVATGLGAHAAGVIIGDGTPLNQIVPLLYNTKMNQWAVQCNMVEAERMGLLKMDFLGLNNLDIISDCLRKIKADYGLTVDLDHIPFESEVFEEIFSKGNTSCVFQFESGGMKKMLREFKPSSIEDVIALVALYRPGPMDFIPDVIAVKQGKKKPHYIVPQLKDILDPTYGQPVYQEQLMDIFHKCAGFSLGEADIIRRYMSKKKVDKFLAYKPQFVSGIIESGATKEEAEEFWESLTGFAKYAFNKSHAAAYAMISYQTAWLKYHYPAEYMCSVMNHSENAKMSALLYECKQMKIKIIPPDINKSQEKFTTNNEGNIVYGLGLIKGVNSYAKDIIDERHANGFYESFNSFLNRAHKNKGVTEKLIMAGAFDNCDVYSRTSLLYSLEGQLDALTSLKKKKQIVEKMTAELSQCNETTEKKLITKRLENAKNSVERAKLKLREKQPSTSVLDDTTERLKEEYELLGAYISDHPLNSYHHVYEKENVTKIGDFEEDIWTTFAGLIKDVRLTKRKSDGAEMAFFTLEDLTGTLDVNCFTASYSLYHDLIKEGNVVKIFGRTSLDDSFSDEAIPKLTVKRMEICRCYKKHIFISVKSREEYEGGLRDKLGFFFDDLGHPVYLHFRESGDIVEPGFFVSPDILETKIENVTILT